MKKYKGIVKEFYNTYSSTGERCYGVKRVIYSNSVEYIVSEYYKMISYKQYDSYNKRWETVYSTAALNYGLTVIDRTDDEIIDWQQLQY